MERMRKLIAPKSRMAATAPPVSTSASEHLKPSPATTSAPPTPSIPKKEQNLQKTPPSSGKISKKAAKRALKLEQQTSAPPVGERDEQVVETNQGAEEKAYPKQSMDQFGKIMEMRVKKEDLKNTKASNVGGDTAARNLPSAIASVQLATVSQQVMDSRINSSESSATTTAAIKFGQKANQKDRNGSVLSDVEARRNASVMRQPEASMLPLPLTHDLGLTPNLFDKAPFEPKPVPNYTLPNRLPPQIESEVNQIHAINQGIADEAQLHHNHLTQFLHAYRITFDTFIHRLDIQFTHMQALKDSAPNPYALRNVEESLKLSLYPIKMIEELEDKLLIAEAGVFHDHLDPIFSENMALKEANDELIEECERLRRKCRRLKKRWGDEDNRNGSGGDKSIEELFEEFGITTDNEDDGAVAKTLNKIVE